MRPLNDAALRSDHDEGSGRRGTGAARCPCIHLGLGYGDFALRAPSQRVPNPPPQRGQVGGRGVRLRAGQGSPQARHTRAKKRLAAITTTTPTYSKAGTCAMMLRTVARKPTICTRIRMRRRRGLVADGGRRAHQVTVSVSAEYATRAGQKCGVSCGNVARWRMGEVKRAVGVVCASTIAL